MLSSLWKHQCAFIFHEPVNVEALNIPDYYTIVRRPMDFGTIKQKLKDQRYQNISEFIDDMELVFYNCKLYNGETSQVGTMGKAVDDEYRKQLIQLNFDFYMKM